MKKALFIVLILILSISATSAQWTFDRDFVQKPQPHGIVVDKSGKIWIGYYASSDTLVKPSGTRIPIHPLWVYDNTNDYEPTKVMFMTIGGVTDTIKTGCRGLALDNNGNVLFTGSQVMYRINYRTLEGMTKYLHPVTGSLTKAACDANGYIYVTKVVPGGTPLVILDTNFQLYGYVLDSCTTIQRSLLVSPDGKDVYIGTIYSGRNGVRHYHSDDGPDGTYAFVDTLGTTLTKVMWAECLDWDPWGNMWVGTYWDVGVNDFTGWYKLDPKKNFAIVDSIGVSAGKFVGGSKPDDGKFYSPRGIAFWQEGSYWRALTNDFDGNVVKLWKNNNPIPGGSHFLFKSNTGESYSIVVDAATIDGQSVQPGDEIGVFTPAGLCVGASIWTGTTPVALTAWKDDSQTPEIDGYKDGEKMSFRIWDNSAAIELAAIPTYSTGNGNFGNGAYARISLLKATSIGQLMVSIQDATGSAGSMMNIPLLVTDVTGKGIISVALTVQTDTSVLIPLDAFNIGTITAGWQAPTYSKQNGQINIAMTGATPLSGSGFLVFIKFLVNSKAAMGNNSVMHLEKIMFNEGDPTATTRDGVFTVTIGTKISGKINYYPNELPVKNVLVSLKGSSSYEVTTDMNGQYEFMSVLPGNYTSSPKKKDDLDAAISPFDAGLILQYAVGQRSFTPYQMLAADVSGNGQVTAYDASLILRYYVKLIPTLPVVPDSVHFWRFVPKSYLIDNTNWSTAPDTLRYAPLNSDKLDQNFVGIIYGDPSGNWNPSGAVLASGKSFAKSATFRLGDIQQLQDKSFTIPIEIDEGSELISSGLIIEFDSKLLKIVDITTTELTSGFTIVHSIESGKIKIALAGSRFLTQDGAIVNIKCEILEASKDMTNAMALTNVLVNEGNILANIQPSDINSQTTVPAGFALYQNYPNPFNPETTIKYQLPQKGRVELKIFNIAGQQIKTLVNEEKEAGCYEVRWDGTDNSGKKVSSGLYIYQLKSGDFFDSKKLAVLR